MQRLLRHGGFVEYLHRPYTTDKSRVFSFIILKRWNTIRIYPSVSKTQRKSRSQNATPILQSDNNVIGKLASSQTISRRFYGTRKDQRQDSREADILSGFSSGARKVWAKYCSNPEGNNDLLQLYKEFSADPLDVAKLGRAMSMSSSPKSCGVASRLLFDAERRGSRFAALYIVRTALGVQGSFHLSPVANATAHVLRLAERGDDLPALTLKARLLQFRGSPQARAAYEQALQLLESANYRPENAEDEVISGSDLLYAYAMLNFTTGDRNDYFAALAMLKRAGLEGGHLEACIKLVSEIPQDPAEYTENPELEEYRNDRHRILVKLAASGHHAAISALGDMYSCSQENFQLLDPVVQQEIRDSPKVALTASLPLGFTRMLLVSAKTIANQSSTLHGIGYFFRNWLRRVYLTVRMGVPARQIGGQDRSERGHSSRIHSSVLHQTVHRYVSPTGKERYYKALDWFHFGRAVRSYQAMVSGARLSHVLGLPYEAASFKAGCTYSKEEARMCKEMDKVYSVFNENFIKQGSKAHEEFLADWKVLEGYRVNATESYAVRSRFRRWFRV